MLGENMIMAFNAIRANKLRSLLTMLGIIIGIGSVIAIVSIGDTMRGMFADLYKDVGITQAYVGIGYWVEDTRDGDYLTWMKWNGRRRHFPMRSPILTATRTPLRMPSISAPPSSLSFRALTIIIRMCSR